MSALQKATPTSYRVVRRDKRPLKGGVKAIKGGLAVAKDGFYKPGVSGTGLRVVGRFTETVDNSGGSDGDLSAEIDFFHDRILTLADNDTGTAVAEADRETPCYVLDDATVTADSTSRSIAGLVYDVTDEGVWFEVDTHLGATGPQGAAGATGPTGPTGATGE
jgi:hypothetical protein